MARNSSQIQRATLFDPTGEGNNVDLGTLGGIYSSALSINEKGQIVGHSEIISGNGHAALFDPTGNGNNIDLDTLDGAECWAESINNNGQIVGMTENDPEDIQLAVLIDSTGGKNNIDLNTLIDRASGWTLKDALAINDNGWIVGYGINPTGKGRAFLLIPKPSIIYVDDDAAGANDGSSWADAFNYLQDALAAVYSGDEIRVAQGIYTPDSNSAHPNGSGDREATFQLINGVTLKGGYAGAGTPDPDARDIDAHETILSGDLNGNDVDVNDPADLLDEATRGDNSYHVVTGYQTDSMDKTTDVLDGFIVTGGNADSSSYPGNRGGGMFCNSDATLTNCTFISNSADWGGGGMYCGPSWCCVTCPTLTNCTFIGNAVGDGGGGLWVGDSDPILTNCKISGNSAGKRGGGLMFGNDNFTMMLNCLINANSAGEDGGGIYGVFCFRWTMNNCTLTGNSAEARGGGIYNEDGSDMTLTNCILWEDSPEEISGEWTAWVTVNHSCIQGGWLGNDNIDTDPLFVDADGADNVAGTEDDNLRLPAGSPCIDAGDPNYIAEPNEIDLDGNPRVIHGRIDMGAYELPIFAETRFVPRTINLASKGKSITCYIRLPESYNVADIDPNSVLLERQMKPEQFSVDEHKQVATAAFDREKVQSILNVGDIELTITCRLTNGTVFEGTDTIKVLNKAGKN
ncbi:MAG: choice-of-anchor Q domain-containing protein, partial [Planctomycetota bacterium]|jgi:probable HAF family extracellular repeat protein